MTTYSWTLHEQQDGEPTQELSGDTERDLNAACSAVSQAMRAAADHRGTTLAGDFFNEVLVGDMETPAGGRKTFKFEDGTAVVGRVWRNDN